MPKIEPFEKYTNRYEEWFDKNKFVYESEVAAVRRLIPNPDKLEITNIKFQILISKIPNKFWSLLF